MHSLRQALAFAILSVVPLVLVLAENPAATPKNSTVKKKSTVTARQGTPAPRKTSSTRTAAPRQTWRARQLQPTPERYKEIQQALASKGYLSGEPTGTWNQDSADALRRFQEDQKINPSGKIDALSLIALGLGPKRGPAPASPGQAEPKPETPAQAPAAN